MESRLKKVYDVLCKNVPSIAIEGSWLINIGFGVGTAFSINYQSDYICISAMPESDFELFNSINRQTDNISNIKLIRKVIKDKRGFPQIMLQGHFLGKLGFKIGTNVLLKYSNGVIHIRALHI